MKVRVKEKNVLEQPYVVVENKRTGRKLLAKQEHARKLQRQGEYNIKRIKENERS